MMFFSLDHMHCLNLNSRFVVGLTNSLFFINKYWDLVNKYEGFNNVRETTKNINYSNGQ